MTREIALGYVPLVDAAPLILADVLGFAEEEGLHLALHRAANWSMLRDMLDQGQVTAAQMLSVMPIARAMGLGAGAAPLESPLILSLGGQVIGASAERAAQMQRAGYDFGFQDAAAAAVAVTQPQQGLRIGVPFAQSMHALLVSDWLSSLPAQSIEFRTVPPPLMPEALADGEVDLFCVGEPWGSQSVLRADARLLLPGTAIRPDMPEKVLAFRAGWCDANSDFAGRLVRALSRAGHWLSVPENAATAAEIITRPGRVDVAPELVERALTGRIATDRAGHEHCVAAFQTFGPVQAMRPLATQAEWIAARLAQRFGLPAGQGESLARACFRSDLHDQFLRLITA